MIAKHTFWIQRILLLFLFTFSAVSFQQKVNKNSYIQNVETVNNIENTLSVSQEPQFQNILFIQSSGRLNTALKPIGESLEEKEEEEKNTTALLSKICTFSRNFAVSSLFFNKFLRISFCTKFSVSTRLYGYICCWRI